MTNTLTHLFHFWTHKSIPPSPYGRGVSYFKFSRLKKPGEGRNNWVRVVAIFGFWILFLGFSASYAEYVPGEIIVKFKSASASKAISIKSSAVSEKLAKIKAIRIERAFPRERQPRAPIKMMSGKQVRIPDLTLINRIFIPKDADISTAIKELRALPEIEYAEPNYIYHAFLTPNDQYFSLQYGLAKISCEAGWDATTGTSEVIVGIVDTGVNYNHADLAGKIILGYDYSNSDSDPMDDNGHGTHLAGIIGASTNNSVGIAGVNWNVKILAVKSLDSGGSGTSLGVARGINYAANNSAEVVNMSFGQPVDDATIKDSIISAYGKGCVLVAAAGNDDVNTPEYPAAYNDYVIAVGSTDQNDAKSEWGTNPNTGALQGSNYGTWVDVCAPGTLIWSTWHTGSYLQKNGTSMATPHVAALASLILSQDQTFTQSEVRSRIENSCDNIDSANPSYVGLLGRGRINVAKALGLPIAKITSPSSASYVSGTIEVSGSATSAILLNYEVQVGTGYPATLYQTLAAGTSAISQGTLCSFNTKIKSDGIHTLKLICRSTNALTSETTTKITIDNTGPIAVITSPADSAVVSGTVEIIGTASDTNLAYYALSYAKDSDYTQITSSATSVASSTLGLWNTKGLSGPYKLKLAAEDAAGHQTTKVINLEISAQDSSEQKAAPGLIKSTPNPFNPVSQSTTYFSYTLSSNSPIIIYLFNMNGELICTKSYASGDNGGKAGNNLAPWNGRDSYGQIVSTGVYFYKILDATGGRKTPIGSGRVIVIR
ncbi:S8 family serine peptidase [Candidatus Saganbacteria bacterium]|nr:S8 family serine peptidase [Candidatus Saganbacteria bacterium]